MLKFFAIGNLTADPRVGEHNGKTVVNFSVAARTASKGADGTYVTNFIDVSAWSGLAASCQRLKKGEKVCVIGNGVVKPYTTQDGRQGFNIVMSPDTVEFLTPHPQNEDVDIFN